jgi:DNA-binding transcriptional ArsR family regulator
MQRVSRTEPTEHSRDALFSLLRNERRREVIHYLRDREEPVDLRELSEHVAAIENDCEPAAVTYKQRKRVQTALYQMHLPKLAEQGVVSYDRRAGKVELAAGAEECFAYLDAGTDPGRGRWWRWYLLVAGAAAVPVGLAALGVWPFASVPSLGYAAAACVAFVVVSLAHLSQV